MGFRRISYTATAPWCPYSEVWPSAWGPCVDNMVPGMSGNTDYKGTKAIAILIICLKSILNWKFAKSYLSITSILVDAYFWNFAQNMAVWLPCSVQNFGRIWWLGTKLRTSKVMWDFSWRWILCRLSILLCPCISLRKCKVVILEICPEHILNSYLAKTWLSLTSILVVQTQESYSHTLYKISKYLDN